MRSPERPKRGWLEPQACHHWHQVDHEKGMMDQRPASLLSLSTGSECRVAVPELTPEPAPCLHDRNDARGPDPCLDDHSYVPVVSSQLMRFGYLVVHFVLTQVSQTRATLHLYVHAHSHDVLSEYQALALKLHVCNVIGAVWR